ncbi:MAG: type IV secretory system conjugative DNA transfer family protein [Bdellovibrionota bacterium]
MSIVALGIFSRDAGQDGRRIFRDPFFPALFLPRKGVCYIALTTDDASADLLVQSFYSALEFTFPGVEIHEGPDFIDEITPDMELASTELYFKRSFIYPTTTGKTLKVNPLAPLANTMINFPPEDRVIVQTIITPLKDDAFLQFYIARSRAIDRFTHKFEAKYWFKRDAVPYIHEKIEEKCKSRIYQVTIRLAAFKECEQTPAAKKEMRELLKKRLHSMIGAYAILNDSDLNTYLPTPVVYGERALKPLKNRTFGRKVLLSPIELAAAWHPTGDFSNMPKVLSRHYAPPPDMPQEEGDPNVCFFARTNYRETKVPFGFSRPDRRKHLYVLGKSGTGKSCMLQLLIKNDMENGHGVGVIDPHGDLISNLLKLVPKNRVDDVIILDPSDRDFPASFNPLAWVPEPLRTPVTLGIVAIFRKLLGERWNEHIDYLVRVTVLALLSTHDATLLSIPKILTDEKYRATVASAVSDDGIRKFWLYAFDSWSEDHQADAIIPLIDVLRHFLSSDMIRNIVGQPVNRFDFRSIMDDKKILLVKVSKGLLGDENATLFGALVVSKIYQAAMSRADIPQEERKDFYFYIDEFQTFAAENVKDMLAESRKYHLNLTLAHQFLQQLPSDVSNTIFGNVGNVVTFCVSGDDADVVTKELLNEFDLVSLTNLPLREFYVKMLVNDKSTKPFSGTTLTVEYPEDSCADECVTASRSQYAVPLKQAEDMILRWEKGDNFIVRPEVFGEPTLDLRQHLRYYGTVLQLSDLNITDEHLLQLSHTAFDNVKKLVLTNTRITDKGLTSIANLRNLTQLFLDGTDITDSGLKAITVLPRLRILNLSRTAVSALGLAPLRSSKIRKLILRETKVTDNGLNYLTEFKRLSEVALERTAISDKALDQLCSNLPNVNIHA